MMVITKVNIPIAHVETEDETVLLLLVLGDEIEYTSDETSEEEDDVKGMVILSVFEEFLLIIVCRCEYGKNSREI